MSTHDRHGERSLEIFLLIVALGTATLFYVVPTYKLVVLNLFFLPVVLAGFFLGRYRAGVLSLFCMICAAAITALDLNAFAVFNSPISIGLTVVIWAAVLGLTALLVGTLSDERNEKIVELHEAYVGVVEVLSKYLQSANPRLKAHSNRVAQLAHEVAVRLRLSPREIDDIRVAALLHDIENIEITSRVICRAVGNLEEDQDDLEPHTFHGLELVHSLSSVLSGALPLLLEQSDVLRDDLEAEEDSGQEIALGAKIIRAARAYEALLEDDFGLHRRSPQEAIDELRDDPHAGYDPLVLDELQRVVFEVRPGDAEEQEQEIALIP